MIKDRPGEGKLRRRDVYLTFIYPGKINWEPILIYNDDVQEEVKRMRV